MSSLTHFVRDCQSNRGLFTDKKMKTLTALPSWKVNLSESSVLADYLEDAYPENPLYPADAEARAGVRQLMKVSELYMDLPARRLIPVQIFNMPADEALLEEVRAVLDRGARSINALASMTIWMRIMMGRVILIQKYVEIFHISYMRRPLLILHKQDHRTGR